LQKQCKPYEKQKLQITFHLSFALDYIGRIGAHYHADAAEYGKRYYQGHDQHRDWLFFFADIGKNCYVCVLK